jgi:NADH-quinone oxidoreductase subunit A
VDASAQTARTNNRKGRIEASVSQQRNKGGIHGMDWGLTVYIVAVLGLVGLMLGASYLLGGRSVGRAKQDPFESGAVAVGTALLRMPAKFYLVAMFFVIFDLEAVFLYAWAVSVRQNGWAGFAMATLFIAVLLAALFYLWRVSGLDWSPGSKRDPQVTRI